MDPWPLWPRVIREPEGWRLALEALGGGAQSPLELVVVI